MDATNQRFAYRCLPLNIANAYGWEVLCNAGFLAMWWGGEGLDSIVIEPGPRHHRSGDQLFWPRHPHLPSTVPVQYRAGRRADGAGADQPAKGWYRRALRRDRNRLVAVQLHHELDVHPAGHAGPLREGRALFSTFFQCGAARSKTSSRSLRCSLPTLTSSASTITWTASRERFNVDLKQPGSEAQSDKWQKLYSRGLAPDGTQAATESHRTRLRLQPFKAPRR